MAITIAGGTGTVGAGVTRALIAHGENVRVLTREPEQAANKLGRHDRLELVQIDYGEPEQLAEAFRGSERAFIGIATTPTQIDNETALIAAAVQAGVGHVVKLSCEGVESHATNVILQIHREIEGYLKATGVTWTMIRPATFIDAVLRVGSMFIPKDVWGGHTADGAAAF